MRCFHFDSHHFPIRTRWVGRWRRRVSCYDNSYGLHGDAFSITVGLENGNKRVGLRECFDTACPHFSNFQNSFDELQFVLRYFKCRRTTGRQSTRAVKQEDDCSGVKRAFQVLDGFRNKFVAAAGFRQFSRQQVERFGAFCPLLLGFLTTTDP